MFFIVTSIVLLSAIRHSECQFHTLLLEPRIFESTVPRQGNIYSNVYFEQPTKLRIIELGEWALELNPTANLVVADGLKGEWIAGDGGATLKDLGRCDYTRGVVRGLETSSIAAVTVCAEQITGYVNVAGFDHFFQPMNATSRTHVLTISFLNLAPNSEYHKKRLVITETT